MSLQGNDGDSVTEVTETSWLKRIGQSIAGVIFGLLFIAGSCVLIFWNEGRAVITARSLTEGAGLVQSVSADKVDPANDGKLIHVTGLLATSGPAVDEEFAVKGDGMRLVRTVEMYQWTEESKSETEKKLGGGETTRTTYEYRRAWADHPIDSGKFKQRDGHTNPEMTYRSQSVLAPGAKLGAFSLPESLLRDFGRPQKLPATDEQVQAVKRVTDRPVQIADGVLYVANDPGQPAVGDYRIVFASVAKQTASVVARQAGTAFEPYRAKAGGTVELMTAGDVPAAEMFKEAEDTNRMWTWLLRGAGVLVMFIGFSMILRPLAVVADVIPFLGSIVGAGTGLVAFLCTVALAPVVIAVAWFYYRPIVAIVVLAVGAALVYGIAHLSRSRVAARKAAPAA
jgi:hypothetical protein